jgi:hypothetical protein
MPAAVAKRESRDELELLAYSRLVGDVSDLLGVCAFDGLLALPRRPSGSTGRLSTSSSSAA